MYLIRYKQNYFFMDKNHAPAIFLALNIPIVFVLLPLQILLIVLQL